MGNYQVAGGPYSLAIEIDFGGVSIVVDPEASDIHWELYGTENSTSTVDVGYDGGVFRVIAKEPGIRIGGIVWKSLTTNGGIDLALTVPDNATASSITLGCGNLQVRGGSMGVADIKSGKGDISISFCGHTTFVGDSFGSTSHIKTGMGSIHVGMGSDMSLTTGMGTIRVDNLRGDASLKTGTGDIAVRRVESGKLTAYTGMGDVTIGIPQGTAAYLDCSSGLGDVKSSLQGSGEPDVDRPRVSVTAKTGVGGVKISYA